MANNATGIELDLDNTLVPGEFTAEFEQKSMDSLFNTSALWKEAYSTRSNPKAENRKPYSFCPQHPEHLINNFFSSVTVTAPLLPIATLDQKWQTKTYPPVYKAFERLTRLTLLGQQSISRDGGKKSLLSVERSLDFEHHNLLQLYYANKKYCAARAHSSGADSAGLRLNSAVALVEKSKCLNGDFGLGLTTVLLASNEG
uniref:Uncharacterized protein n=1 Tax=Glossina austeni TaxID=7395 RepID=A0A1A9VT59_GLOAU